MNALLSCPVCSSTRIKSLYKLKGSDVVECVQCTMVFVPSVLPEVTSIYGQDYFAGANDGHGYSSYRSELVSHIQTFTSYLIHIEKMLGRVGKVLDLGCALGHFGEAAKRLKWDVYVTDVSEYAVHEARKSFSLNAFVSPSHKLPVKNKKFDLISMYEVIEHISDPKDLMKQVHNAITPDGLLHLTTPNVSSWSAKLMGKSWYHFKPNEHLLYFSPETLRLYLENCGFDVIKIKPVPIIMRVHDVFLRLERYWKWGASTARKIFQFIGLGDIRLRLYVGQMQAWARPSFKDDEVHVKEPVQDILDIVCCPKCRSAIQLFEEVEAICTQCEQSFEVRDGVINFSKYAKRSKERIIGTG
jgi:SAM-dependent methyltransferase